MKQFRETLFNRDCAHHRLFFPAAERCPFCGEPSIRALARRRWRIVLVSSVLVWAAWLTWSVLR